MLNLLSAYKQKGCRGMKVAVSDNGSSVKSKRSKLSFHVRHFWRILEGQKVRPTPPRPTTSPPCVASGQLEQK